MKDLGLSLRQLQKSKGFSITILLTLALGIGAITAMFTLVYDVLLTPIWLKAISMLAIALTPFQDDLRCSSICLQH